VGKLDTPQGQHNTSKQSNERQNSDAPRDLTSSVTEGPPPPPERKNPAENEKQSPWWNGRQSVQTDEIAKIKLLFADVIEELGALEMKILDLSFSLAVVKEAAQSCAPANRFEVEYARLRKVLDKSQSTIQPSQKLDALRRRIQELRQESRAS
jgi:hypothetical protein